MSLQRIISARNTLLLLVLFLFSAGQVQGNGAASKLAWNTLTFEASKFFVKYTTTVSIKTVSPQKAKSILKPDSGGQLLITGHSPLLLLETDIRRGSDDNKHWKGSVLFLADEKSALQRTRHKIRHSYKVYRYAQEGVFRQRKTPRNHHESELGHGSWTRSQELFFDYPTSRSACGNIIDPLTLFYLVSATHFTQGDQLVVCVFNKKSLYRVTLSAIGTERVKAKYTAYAEGNKTNIKGKIEALRVAITAQAVDPQAEELEEFEFLELSKDIEFLIDPSSRLPLKIRGMSPVAGNVEFNLKEATVF